MKAYSTRLFVLICSASFLATHSGQARNEWLTAKTVGGTTVPMSAEALASPLPPDGNVPANLAAPASILPLASTATLDVTMSIADDPAGDNQGNTQGQAGSEEQDKWERIVQHYADAIYEMTEGAHTIRKVRIFKKGKFASSADIVWTAKGHPHVMKGVGEPGGRVNMFNTFENGILISKGKYQDKPMLDDEVGSGYTMAHEFGHYYYGLYDEYPQTGVATDIAVAPSVMANQWAGAGDKRWLNFSIKEHGGGDYQDTLFNRQHRIHGASAWETLVRSPSLDPGGGSLGRRVRYLELGSVAPTGTNLPVVNLPNSAARASLNIIWADKSLYEIVIDNSGSMSGSPMTNALTAAKLLVDRAELGQSRIGVIKFNSTATIAMPVTEVNTDTDKNNIKAAIDAISAGGNTAIGDAANLALGQVQAGASALDTGVVFLLSDGASNTGVDPLSVIPAYQTAQVPLFTFAFGGGADASVLRTMAEQTGGKFYVSPTSLADITLAFQDAFSSATSESVLAESSATVAAKKTVTTTFPVDLGISTLNLNVIIPSVGVTVQLVSPHNVTFFPTTTTTSGSETVVSFSIDNPDLGNWRLIYKSTLSSGTSTVKYTIEGTPGPGSLALTAYSVEGTAVQFPAPVLVRAKLDGARAVIGASVTATATSPTGVVSTFLLKDDGNAPDQAARDGTYSGYFYYTSIGSYTFNVKMDNHLKTAKFTSGGAAHSPGVGGFSTPVEPDSTVGRSFARSARFAVTTSGGIFTSSVKQLPIGTYATILGTEIDHAHSGHIRVALSANGVFSGKLFYGGCAYALAGKFNANGGYARTIARKGLPSLQLSLRIDALNFTNLMTGDLIEGGLTIPISASRTLYTTHLPAPEAGKHTWAILPEAGTTPSQVPPGVGYATVTVSATGMATVAGKLADGSAITCTSQVTGQHELPVYFSLYATKGSAYGTLSFLAAHDFEGDIKWFKAANPKDLLYAAGFETTAKSSGAAFVSPGRGTKAINIATGSLDLSDGGLTSPNSSTFDFTSSNAFVFSLPNSYAAKLALSLSTGLLTGEFRHPATNKVVKLYGTVLQNQNAGGGYFLGVAQGGSFEFGSFAVPGTTVIYNATGLPIAIPDSNTIGITSSQSITQSGTITGAKVSLDITHTYRGDLVVTLISPAGTSIILHNRVGGSTDNLNIADLAVAEVVGQSATGTWQLVVADQAGGDIGSLEAWSLKLTTR